MLLRTFAIVFFSCTSLLGLTLVAEPSIGAPQQELKRASVAVETTRGEIRLSPEIAVTPVEQEIGLMGRAHSSGEAGMYFPQAKPGIVEISTAGTPFPIDVVFVGPEGRISRIDTVAGRSADGTVRSPGQVSAYLQLPSGMTERLGMKPGDRLFAVGEG